MKKKVISILSLLLVISLFSTMSVSAATKCPFKDVNKKTVTSKDREAIIWAYEHGLYKGVVKGKKLNPYKKIPTWEFLTMAANANGKNNVPVSTKDVIRANKKIKYKWACKKLSQVAGKRADMTITWSNIPKGSLTRADAARLFKIFAEFNEALKPIK